MGTLRSSVDPGQTDNVIWKFKNVNLFNMATSHEKLSSVFATR